MSTSTESVPAGRGALAPSPVAPGSIVVGLLIALCALLLLKWLAVVALAAVALAGLVAWARRRAPRRLPAASPSPSGAVTTAPAVDGERAAECSWCGLVGGHRDRAGRLVRPRYVHPVR